MRRNRYFVKPPAEAFASPEGTEYIAGFRTYAEYNYLRAGLASSIKAQHFEAALELTREHFHRCSVVDFGCADGVFLPSLSRHFDRVLAVDRAPAFVATASRMVKALALPNVAVRLNEAPRSHDVLVPGAEGPYRIAYLLEVLEHVGERGDLYGAKLRFLHQVASLLSDDGLLVVSVPRMIGVPFLAQRLGLALLGLQREEISVRDLLRAGLLGDTEELERNWKGEDAHLGFNHLKLERSLRGHFRVISRKRLPFQVVYLLATGA